MKIDFKKAVYFLLTQKYLSEFKSIDGLSQHPDGLNFEEWLKEKHLTEECRIKDLEAKAKKWDELENKISKFYSEDDNGNVDDEGDLSDIGEVAASAFGYM